MTTYVYTGGATGTGYMQGLPTGNLDTATMTAAELAILTDALAAGLYEVSAVTTTLRPTSIED
jgi:hypothetical protein